MTRSGPVLWCVIAAALFGASTPAAKALLGAVDPLPLAGLLYLGAALAVLPLSLRGGSAARRRDPANLRRLGGAVLFGGVLGPALLLTGLALAPSASVSLWLNLETVATAALAWAIFRENVEGRVWVANGLVLGAGVLLAAPGGFGLGPAAGLVALACLCWGLDNNLTALIDGYTPEQSTLVKGLAAGAFNLALGAALGQRMPGLGTAALALLVGGLGYGLSIALYIRGAQHLGATRSQMIFASAPFLGVLVAWGALGEPGQAAQLGAAAVLVAALGLMLTAHHGHAHRHDAVVHTHPHRHDDEHHTHRHPGLPDEAWHTHEHRHEPVAHDHPHQPDLHHRHAH